MCKSKLEFGLDKATYLSSPNTDVASVIGACVSM